MKTLVFEAVVAGSSRQLQLLLAQSRRIVAGGFELPADLDVNCADRSGVTPLHAAVLKGNLQMVKVLLEAGADCLCADSLGHSPLYLAQSKQCADIVHTMHSHLSALRAKSPESRPSLQLSAILCCAPAAEAAARAAATGTASSPGPETGTCEVGMQLAQSRRRARNSCAHSACRRSRRNLPLPLPMQHHPALQIASR